jgi:4-hydroxybenzoyl-CoA thioesterase
MKMPFVSRQLVRFAHVDGAGIVFYPRYFELLNAAVEDYFAQHVGIDFAAMHLERRLGDRLDFTLIVERVGTSSAMLRIEVRCADELRFTAELVLVCMDLDAARSCPWPDDLRPRP